MADTTTRLAGISYRYTVRGGWVLRDVNLDIESGSINRIIGANGSGKSTLLRIAASARRPTRGRITGRERAGFVPGVFPELPFTTLGYLRRLGRIHELTDREALSRAERWLEEFGATPYRNQPIEDLSRGSAQKVGIVQALLAEPRLLILDEAWTGLDAAAQERLDAVVLDYAQAGRKVLFVDHEGARLAAHVHAAYRFDDGALRVVVPGEALESAGERSEGDGEGVGVKALPGQVVIELEHASDPWPGPGKGRRLPDGRLRLVAESGESDDLLRRILREHPKVHVRSIEEVP